MHVLIYIDTVHSESKINNVIMSLMQLWSESPKGSEGHVVIRLVINHGFPSDEELNPKWVYFPVTTRPGSHKIIWSPETIMILLTPKAQSDAKPRRGVGMWDGMGWVEGLPISTAHSPPPPAWL